MSRLRWRDEPDLPRLRSSDLRLKRLRKRSVSVATRKKINSDWLKSRRS